MDKNEPAGAIPHPTPTGVNEQFGDVQGTSQDGYTIDVLGNPTTSTAGKVRVMVSETNGVDTYYAVAESIYDITGILKDLYE